jgi:hypothetical protein
MSDISKDQTIASNDINKVDSIKDPPKNQAGRKPVNIPIERKKEVALMFVNRILKNINDDKHVDITDLTEFQKIDRDAIISENNVKLVDEMGDVMFRVFSKTLVRYGKRHEIKNYILSFLRSICSDIGLQFVASRKTKTVNNVVGKYYYYSIDTKTKS